MRHHINCDMTCYMGLNDSEEKTNQLGDSLEIQLFLTPRGVFICASKFKICL